MSDILFLKGICCEAGHSKPVGRQVGGESEWGDTCAPVADSHQCTAETTTIL